ncbi:STM2901 family protein [Yersinia bercovieri]|uniref:STM2901 family protein n=1 Tax=Yersinia bercovieri TaxID=634 RepID=UPI0005DC47B3|nr:hypothetical protein [Yersinia bercovieri]MCB5302547.1 hypothetical protein [Yersinia bercovieri]CFQ31388.1 putative phage membrane protein [Yersinia bercovieri]CNE75147.1 putative phage membrane protein [Yersinia bercovieri]
MDTVEQVSGYYFKEMHNLSQGELAFWVTVDEVEKQFNGIDIVAFAFILGGLNIIPVPGKPHTAPPALAFYHLSLRRMISCRLNNRWRSPTWKTLIGGGWARTTSLGGLIGRWIPWLGVAITAYDISIIGYRSVHRYNLIVSSRDRLE